MSYFCGLDFGTSNSTIGVSFKNQIQLVPLENDKPTIRSAIFCDVEEKKWMFGQQGINHYLEGGPGRLMMSLKSVLGSSLMDDETLIFNEWIPYAGILRHFILHLKTKAELFLGHELTEVVMGRPVHFHDSDHAQDEKAQSTLKKLAFEVGFKEVAFQYEPIAAALTYEMSIQKEQLALIIDMGGGTSDFTIIRLHPNNKTEDRAQDVLANTGIHIAGTDFDQSLSLQTVMPLLGMNSLMRGSSSEIEIPKSVYHDLTTWHTLSDLYSAKNISHIKMIQAAALQKSLIERLIRVLKLRSGHHILDSVENTKQRLSDTQEAKLDLSFIENDLYTLISQNNFNAIIHEELEKIIYTIKETVCVSGVKFSDISAIFYTGGSTKIPIVREKINSLFPNAQIVQGDAFGSVGLGLTIDAARRYRA